MDLIDIYLMERDTTRYELAKVSGIPQTSWSTLATKDTNAYKGRHLKALSMMSDETPGEVLDSLIEIELENDDLNGLKTLLNQHNYQNKYKEMRIRFLLDEIDKKGITLKPFTFNRLNNNKITNDDLEIVLNNTVEVLRDILKNGK